MGWALQVASANPELRDAVVDANGEWLDILLADGRTFRFRPFEMISEDAPEPVRARLLDQLIHIGITKATTGTSDGNSSATNTAATGFETPGDHPAEPADSSAFPPTAASTSAHPATTPTGNASGNAGRTASSGTKRGLSGFFSSLFNHAPEQPQLETPPEVGPDSTIVPIVRAADYFFRSDDGRANDSIVYIPLTNFVGAGLAADTPDMIVPVFFSDLNLERGEIPAAELFGKAIQTLRTLNLEQGHKGVELQPVTVGGASAVVFASPAAYQSSWFADMDIIQRITTATQANPSDFTPLFVPATRTSLFIVQDNDPLLPSFFQALARNITPEEAVYPLPHTAAADGWREWIPLPDHPAARILSSLRADFRTRIYAAQARTLRDWPTDFGAIEEASVEHLTTGAVTATRWRRSLGYGTLPDAEFIAFWDDVAAAPTEPVVLRFSVAREVWPEGFQEMDGIWPRRFAVTGFPDADTLRRLREQAGRAF